MAKHTVLIVDDTPDITKLLGMVLQNEGYEVLLAYGGAEAIDLATWHKPDVIVLDIMMPDVSGGEVLEEIKKARSSNKSNNVYSPF
jgi:CheY-like chemotaxis protein